MTEHGYSFVYSPYFYHSSKLFNTFWTESKGSFPGRPYHNSYFNYYHAVTTLFSPKNRSPVYTPSRLYYFTRNDSVIEDCLTAEVKNDRPDCTVYIFQPDLAVQHNLFSVCRTISRNQAISDLFVHGLEVEDTSETDVFRLSKDSQHVMLQECSFSYNLWQNLFRQISNCTSLTVLSLWQSTLCGFTSIDLSKVPSLRILDLFGAKVSAQFIENLCKQLKYLVQLENLVLQETPVGTSCRYITEAVKAWGPDAPLEIINLIKCKIPSQMCWSLTFDLSNYKNLKQLNIAFSDDTLLEAKSSDYYKECGSFPSVNLFNVECLKMPLHVSCTILSSFLNIQHLRHLYFSTNTLTGCLQHFPSTCNAELPSLESLGLSYCELNENDVLHVKYLVDGDKLPKLTSLFVDENNLGRMEHLVDGLIETCVSHWRRNSDRWKVKNMNIWLGGNHFSTEFQKKWDSKLESINPIPEQIHYEFCLLWQELR